MQARGPYVVFYDAEDIPDPLQLKKAVLTFANHGTDVVCVQAAPPQSLYHYEQFHDRRHSSGKRGHLLLAWRYSPAACCSCRSWYPHRCAFRRAFTQAFEQQNLAFHLLARYHNQRARDDIAWIGHRPVLNCDLSERRKRRPAGRLFRLSDIFFYANPFSFHTSMPPITLIRCAKPCLCKSEQAIALRCPLAQVTARG